MIYPVLIRQMSYMWSMFNGASSLNGLDLSSFDTSNVTSMYRMFYGASSLTILICLVFNTSNVTDMFEMFRGTGLTSRFI